MQNVESLYEHNRDKSCEELDMTGSNTLNPSIIANRGTTVIEDFESSRVQKEAKTNITMHKTDYPAKIPPPNYIYILLNKSSTN